MKDSVIIKDRQIKQIVTIIGFLLTIMSIALFIYDFSLEQKSITVNAKIKSLDYSGNNSKIVVSFNITGTTHEAIIDSPRESLSVDDEISVKVNMYKPTQAIKNNHYYIYIPGIVLGAILLILTLPAVIKNQKKQSNIQNIKKTGFYVQANISETFINNNGKRHKGNPPYRLRCKYFNPQTNEEYAFESEDSYINLNEVISEYQKNTITVYIDKKDTKNYYVDLESLYPKMKIVNPMELMNAKTEENTEKEENTNDNSTSNNSEVNTENEQKKE